MDQRYVDLAAAMVRQAFYDLAHDYHHARHMDAAAWLELAGLVDADGTPRYGMPSRRPNTITATTQDENSRRREARARTKEPAGGT